MAVITTNAESGQDLRQRKGETVSKEQAPLVQAESETAKKKTSTTTATKSSSASGSTIRDKTLVEKLVSSKEETYYGHIHKFMGISCLVSFMYRFYHTVMGRDGNFGPHWGTLFFIAHHFSLHLTSYIFDIPKRRINGGYRIWPEYRHHAIAFTSRSLACMLLLWYEQVYHPIAPDDNVTEPDQFPLAQLAIVLTNCALADLGTYLQPPENSTTTVRGTQISDPFEIWFASEMQFLLTGFSLIGLDGRYSVHLMGVAVIQLNAFLMTLRRKNVASQAALTTIYGVLLLWGFWTVIMDDLIAEKALVPGTFGATAICLRMGPLRVNKYLLWTMLGLIWYYIKQTHIVSTYNSMFWLVGCGVMKGIALLLGLRKREQMIRQQDAPNNVIIYRCVIGSHLLLALHIAVTMYIGDFEE